MKFNDLNIQNKVLQSFEKYYGFKILSSKFVPIGEDSYAYAVVTKEKEKYFVKYCDHEDIIENITKIHSLLLQLKHLKFVVPPIEVNKKTSFNIGEGKMYVYPYVEGRVVSAGNTKFDTGLVNGLTEITAQIHNSTYSVSIDLDKESFTNNYLERFERLSRMSKNEKLDNEFITLLNDNKNIIYDLIEKHNLLAQKYRDLNLEFVLTHGDITGLNIILTKEKDLKLVDWDGAMFAPPERDINFLFDNPYFSIDKYLNLTGIKKYNAEMKEYYGQEWSVDSIIGNFESLICNKNNKIDKNDLMGEIKHYLNFYR